MKTKVILGCLLALALSSASAVAGSMGTAFTYQGQLNDGGTPANGIFDFRFSIFDLASGGTALAGPVTNSPVGVTNGLFITTLDFGTNAFTGDARWLEIGVRAHVGGAFTSLEPRQTLTPSPYAIYAGTAGLLDGLLPASQLSGLYPSALTLNNAGNSFSGDGAGLTGLNAAQLTAGTVPASALGNAWKLDGNAGTTAGLKFLGTTDNQPLELKVNNQRAFRLEYATDPLGNPYPNVIGGSVNTISTFASLIGGGRNNNIGTGSAYSTIAGGQANGIGTDSDSSFLGGGYWNNIGTNSSVSAIGGGWQNRITDNSSASTIAGGRNNDIGTNSDGSTIGGGGIIHIADNSFYSTIAGGTYNDIGTNSGYSAIGGGFDNNIAASSFSSTIAGGTQNDIAILSHFSAIGGGFHNDIGTNSEYSTIGGGHYNSIRANSQFATIPGGNSNAATNYAFAAGRRAKANHIGAFVWADSIDADVASTGNNQFIVRAAGGIWLGTSSSPGIPVGRFLNTSTGGYLSTGGAWTDSSDRNAKENFQPVDGRSILERVAQLPITTWNYKTEDAAVRHVGPVAQDFHAAFQVGPDDQHLAALDANGVALAAIQGLNQKLEEQVKTKDSEILDLKQRMEKLERLLSTPAQHGGAR